MSVHSETDKNQEFIGKHYKGYGDIGYIKLLDIARRMLETDEQLPNLSMFYKEDWNAFTLGDYWGAWWIQNTYGASYCVIPFLQEPYSTFLQNSQDFWFDNMGDNKREGLWGGPHVKHLYNLVAPDGCLCDCALPGQVAFKQGDTNVVYTDTEVFSIGYTDWALEFTAAGIVLQGELLLSERNMVKIDKYLPKLERCANFIETRRDPEKNLFLAGPGGNLLAPSYGGWIKEDGTVENAYLTGLSITYIAALDRLIELEKMAERCKQVAIYEDRRKTAKEGLEQLITGEGYFIRSLDPDGTKHGVFGQEKHGYFEMPPNHDAICFRVVDDNQAEKIFDKIVSIPELRPYVFTIPNYPSYDDFPIIPKEFIEHEGKYEGKSLMQYGTWVNGGHWATCEARMIMAYYRIGKYGDAKRSMEKFLTFVERFKMDAPLPRFGNDVWYKDKAINIVYDCFGISNAFIRGLFEYLYNADGLTLIPHIPESITELEQLDPVRFGEKKVYIKTIGKGKIAAVKINGENWDDFNENSIFLSYDKTPDNAYVCIAFEDGLIDMENKFVKKDYLEDKNNNTVWEFIARQEADIVNSDDAESIELDKLYCKGSKLAVLYEEFFKEAMVECYEIAHVKLAIDCVDMVYKRSKLIKEGKISLLNDEKAQSMADEKYMHTAKAMCGGVERILDACKVSEAPCKLRLYRLWTNIKSINCEV